MDIDDIIMNWYARATREAFCLNLEYAVLDSSCQGATTVHRGDSGTARPGLRWFGENQVGTALGRCRCWENHIDPIAGEALCKAWRLRTWKWETVQENRRCALLKSKMMRQRLIQMGGPASASVFDLPSLVFAEPVGSGDIGERAASTVDHHWVPSGQISILQSTVLFGLVPQIDLAIRGSYFSEQGTWCHGLRVGAAETVLFWVLCVVARLYWVWLSLL